jgi:hypothetical protein
MSKRFSMAVLSSGVSDATLLTGWIMGAAGGRTFQFSVAELDYEAYF